MSTTRYKDLVVMLFALGIALLVIDRCNHDKLHYEEVTALDNKVAELEADRMFILDSVEVLNESLQVEREALPKRLKEYSKKSVKERVKLITLIDTFAIQTDTGAILSMHGVDSINKLTIHYQSCMVQSEIKDTIITHLSNVVQADSVIIASQQKSMKLHKKTAKIVAAKVAIISFASGLLFSIIVSP